MFNVHNPTEMAVLRKLAYGEGIITREQFLNLGNRTMLSKYRTAGLVRQMPNAKEGVFQITDKFKTEYTRRIDPNHKFSGSGSPTHAAVLYEALGFIPASAQLTTGQQLKEDFDRFQQTRAYIEATREIRNRYQDERAAAIEAYHSAQAADRAAAFDRYHTAEQLCKMDKLCSTPDLAVTLTAGEVDSLITDLANYYLNAPQLSDGQTWAYGQAIRTLQEVQASGAETVTVYIEAITDSYGNLEIEQKENFSAVMGAPIIYFST